MSLCSEMLRLIIHFISKPMFLRLYPISLFENNSRASGGVCEEWSYVQSKYYVLRTCLSPRTRRNGVG